MQPGTDASSILAWGWHSPGAGSSVCSSEACTLSLSSSSKLWRCTPSSVPAASSIRDRPKVSSGPPQHPGKSVKCLGLTEQSWVGVQTHILAPVEMAVVRHPCCPVQVLFSHAAGSPPMLLDFQGLSLCSEWCGPQATVCPPSTLEGPGAPQALSKGSAPPLGTPLAQAAHCWPGQEPSGFSPPSRLSHWQSPAWSQWVELVGFPAPGCGHAGPKGPADQLSGFCTGRTRTLASYNAPWPYLTYGWETEAQTADSCQASWRAEWSACPGQHLV